jgi:hypothetical protein
MQKNNSSLVPQNAHPFFIQIALKCTTLLILWGVFGIPSISAQTMNVLYLDGNGAHTQLPAEMFHQFTGSTIEAWVKWEKIQSWSRVFDFGREGNALVVQSEKSSRTLNFAIYDRAGKRHRIQAKNAIPVGQWFHLAVSSGSQGMALYINGELRGTDSYTGGLDQVTNGQYYIGRSNWPKDKPFQGYLSEFRIWNQQRSQMQIQRTMERRLTGQEPGLVAYWRFDQQQNDQITDATGNQPTHLTQNARLVSVPPLARYLIPGEMEKDKLARQTSAAAHFERGAYIASYRDYQAALDLVPGDAQIRTSMLQALKNGRIRAALFPFQIQNTETQPETAFVTAYTKLAQNRPDYIDWLSPATTQFTLYEQGVTTQSAHQELIQAAQAWNIQIIALTTITQSSIDKSRPKRKSETAYLRSENQTTLDSLKSVRYNIVTQNVNATAHGTLQLIDVKTGQTLVNHTLSAQIIDQIEYANYSGDAYALWRKRGSRYRRLVKQEKRFQARETLKPDQELLHDLFEDLGQQIAQRIQSAMTTYTP